jgi:hypothetical protein
VTRRALLLALFALAASLPAQQARTIELRVTAAAGRSLFLDRGRADGLLPGLVVRLFPAGRVPIEATVRAVSTNSARADVAPGVELPLPGTRGEASVTLPEPGPAPPPPAKPVPEHPPWTRREAPRGDDQPLLAPAFGMPASDRPSRLHGRTFAQLDWSRDRGAGRDSEYWLARLGTDLELTNPFGAGGRARFAGDLERRTTDLLDESEAHDDRARIERLSYRHGDEEYAPFRAELGRFVSDYVPELGLLDGAEGALRFASGLDAGGGLAAWPLPYPARTSDEDLTAWLFASYAAPDPRGLRALVAYQKSWHEGASDRDLLLARAAGTAGETLSWTAALRADVYTSRDRIKGSGVEPTEAWLQASWNATARSGASLSYSHFEWPELLRREYAGTPPALVANGRVDRVAVSGWFDLSERIRVDLRSDLWDDHVDSGASGEIRLGFDRIVESRTWVGADLFVAEGSSAGGPGFRLTARRPFGAWTASLGYDWLQYEQSQLGAEPRDATRQSLRGSLDWSSGAWQFGLYAQQFFGDDEDALAIDLFFQHHF